MNKYRMIRADSPGDISRAYKKYYSKMADHFIQQLGKGRLGMVLEAGCGKGQLTIPFLKKLPETAKLIAVDSSRGPYEGWLSDLGRNLAREKLASRVRIIEADARRMRHVQNASIDLLISNELLCDLTSEAALTSALREFHRVLRPSGVMVHGEWSSQSTKRFGSFRVKHSPTWTPDQFFSSLTQAGFANVRVSYFDWTICFGYKAAVEELRSWGASETFLKRHDEWLRKNGLQLPPEHVVRCEKHG